MEILFSGICHSDVHVGQNDFGNTQFPCVPGHEILGRVREIGDKVTKFKVGDLVGVGCFVDSCRNCKECENSNENYCMNTLTNTYNGPKLHGGVAGNQEGKTWGGYSASHTVHEHYCHQIPEGLPIEKVAPILCAGITMYEPLRLWGATKGEKMVIGIAGIGGLGTMGIKIAKALGHEVVAISQSMKKEKLAKEKGADHYVASTDPESVKACPAKCHIILNTVSVDHDINTYLPILRNGGTIIQLGLCNKALNVSPLVLMSQNKRIAGCLIGGVKSTEEVLKLCAEHQIWPDCEMVTADKIDWVW
jgi:alcohol dehydrogenase (NADP+)